MGSEPPILPDEWAVNAVGRLDYDFAQLKIGRLRASLIALRAKQLDLWTAAYIADHHPDATVLHIGCG